MAESMRSVSGTPSTRVDDLLMRVRWLLWLFVIPIAWIDNGGAALPAMILIWLAAVAVFNLAIGAVLHFVPNPPTRLPVVTFILDVIFFGLLPHLTNLSLNLLVFFSVFPAVVGAVRFGPQVGLLVAGLLAIPIEIVAFMPIVRQGNLLAVTAGIPIAALLAAVALIGYLAQHEKQAAMKHANAELDELRRAMAGARLLYRTTDALSSSTSYAPVLEAMLEAGVKGLPIGRKDDGPPVGLALLFDDGDPEKRLRVTASRHLDRRDLDLRVAGKAGVVADALQTATPVVFDNVKDDPELSVFAALHHCHSGVCYPLQAGLEQYGVVVLAGAAPRRPSSEHLELMRAFTNQAAIAFQNAKLYQDLRAEHDQIIRNENELRQKLARDLHDGPTQKVAGLVMQLEYISRLIERNPNEARNELTKASQVAEQTVKEIRTALFTLRPLALETKGLSAALEQYCKQMRETESISIQLDPGNFGNELDLRFASTVFAILDEAINNAHKHAGGAPISVSLSRQERSLVAVVQDQGPGFDLDQVVSSYDQRTSLGLQNMRERARLIGGELRIDSQHGRGTRVTLIAPLPRALPTGTSS